MNREWTNMTLFRTILGPEVIVTKSNFISEAQLDLNETLIPRQLYPSNLLVHFMWVCIVLPSSGDANHLVSTSEPMLNCSPFIFVSWITRAHRGISECQENNSTIRYKYMSCKVCYRLWIHLVYIRQKINLVDKVMNLWVPKIAAMCVSLCLENRVLIYK